MRGSPSARDRVVEVLATGRLKLQRLAVENGRTSFYGAGLENHGQVSLDRVSFSFNRASGAFEPGNGGGIANQGQADISRSAFIGNRVPSYGSGAAISNDKGGVLKLSNSTLSGNTGPGSLSNGQYYPPTGGVPQALLINVTIAGNTGYGLNNFGQLSLRNSLIIGNYDEYQEEALNCNNVGANATYRAHGLLQGNGPGNCTAELYRENTQAFTQVLYPLADNNNPLLPPHALRPGSPALDAGLGSCTQHDQRGASRPRNGDGDGVAVCDLGAYERPKP